MCSYTSEGNLIAVRGRTWDSVVHGRRKHEGVRLYLFFSPIVPLIGDIGGIIPPAKLDGAEGGEGVIPGEVVGAWAEES